MARQVAILEAADSDDDVRRQTDLWENALSELGYAIRRLASSDSEAISGALDGCELALVENVCSVPVDRRGCDAATEVLIQFASGGGRVVLHHYDLPWQPDWSYRTDRWLPPRIPGAVHVGVSLRAQRDLHARGYLPAIAIHHQFGFDEAAGDRAATRAALGFDDDDIVLFQPTRAARTTNVAGAVRFLRALHGMIRNRPMRYWLHGPVDDDVAPTITRLLEQCPVPTTIDHSVARRDALAAADVVLLPSTWDRSGAPVVESVIARRPCVAGPFPVLGELQAVGLRVFDLDEPVELVKFLAGPSERLHDVNLRRARLSFSADELRTKVADVLALASLPA